jgi:hypothetical protein
MQKHALRTTIWFAVTAIGLATGRGEMSTPTGRLRWPATRRVRIDDGTARVPGRGHVSHWRRARGRAPGYRRVPQHLCRHAAGYTTENEPCVSSPARTMGIHAPNLALIVEPALDPLQPELLLYVPGPNGPYRLVAVEYFQAVLLRDVETQEVAPRLDPAPWDPARYEVVNPKPHLFGQPDTRLRVTVQRGTLRIDRHG